METRNKIVLTLATVAKHLGNIVAEGVYEVRYRSRQVGGAMRKRTLERELERRGISYENEDKFDIATFEHENRIKSYIWGLASIILKEDGAESELFDEVAGSILTKKEKRLMVRNVRKGEDPTWGIASVRDTRYRIKDLNGEYGVARELVDRCNLNGRMSWYINDIPERIESSPLFLVDGVKGD